MIMINKGKWWYIGNSSLKFALTKFGIETFEDLKKIFKFSKENFELILKNNKLKKIGYNFYINNKKVKKSDVIELLEQYNEK